MSWYRDTSNVALFTTPLMTPRKGTREHKEESKVFSWTVPRFYVYHSYNILPLWGQSTYISQLFYDIDCPHRPTQVFSTHFVLTHAHPGRTSWLVTHPKIALGQARLTLEFFGDWYEYPINLVKPRLGCYILTPLRDQRPRRSIPSQERPLLATSVCLVPAHVPCCVTTLGPL
jgi:hypothetical protein